MMWPEGLIPSAGTKETYMSEMQLMYTMLNILTWLKQEKFSSDNMQIPNHTKTLQLI